MAFTLSGTTITQTGTDNDLSGLAGISEITVTDRKSHIEYYMHNLKLLIQGSLTIAPKDTKEQLRIRQDVRDKNNIEVANGGTLIIGTQQSNPLDYEHQDYIPAIQEDIGAVGYPIRNAHSAGIGNGTRFATLTVRDGGTLRCFARVVNVAAFGVQTNATAFEVQYSFLIKHQASYVYSRNVTIENSTYASFSIVASGAYASLKNNKVIGPPFALSNNTPLGSSFDINGIPDLNGVALVAQGRESGADDSNSPIAKAYNLAKGTDQTYQVNERRYWRAELWAQVRVAVKDAARAAVDSAKLYYKGAGGTQTLMSVNADGHADFDFLMATRKASNGTIAPYVFQTKNGDTSDDLIDIAVADYGYAIAQVSDFSLRGVERRLSDVFLITDALISETDKAVVAAYTQIDTAAKLYDRAKAYLINTYAGEAAQMVTRTDDTIDAGGYNIEIDKNAAATFAFDGTKITIKADTFTGNLKTTGAVTFKNGATIDGAYEDKNGVLVSIDLPANCWAMVRDKTGGTVRLSATQYANASKAQFQIPKNTDFILAIKQRDKAPFRAEYNSASGLNITPQTAAQFNYDTSHDISSYTGDWSAAYASNKMTLTINEPISKAVQPADAAKNLLDYVMTSAAGVQFIMDHGGEAYNFTSVSMRLDAAKFDFVRKAGVSEAVQTSLNVLKLADNTKFAPSDSNVYVPNAGQVFQVDEATIASVTERVNAGIPQAVLRAPLQDHLGAGGDDSVAAGIQAGGQALNAATTAANHARAANMQTKEPS